MRSKQTGFSLIELLVVVSVILIVAAIAMPIFCALAWLQMRLPRWPPSAPSIRHKSSTNPVMVRVSPAHSPTLAMAVYPRTACPQPCRKPVLLA